MILKANQKYIDMSCVRHLLAVGEKNADFLTFEVSKNYNEIDISECVFILRAVNSAGNLIEQTLKKRIENDSIFLTWTVDEYFTAVSGVLKLEIRGVKNDEIVIKYDLSEIIVRESVVGEGLPEIPDTSVIQGEKGDDGKSTYEIWLSLGNSGTESDFISSLKGEQGETGLTGNSGENGKNGVDGQDGKSAYEIWLSLGNSGTESDFISSLKGEKGDAGLTGNTGKNGIDGQDGKSAYEIWLSLGNSGTESDFISSLKGEKGETGLTGNTGKNGKDGIDGQDGKSAYEIWLSLGNSGTETDFISSLKGEKGETGLTGNSGENGKNGVDGQDGKSAYEIWLSLGNSGTESDFIASLKGKKGDTGLTGNTGKNGKDGVDGQDGKSAYEIWLSLGNSGTETDFITSLKGEKGDTGLTGNTGENGKNGADGFSPIIEIFEDTENSYKLLITDKLNSFKTPNLKGLNGISDDEISDLKNQISNLNNLISEIQTGDKNLKITKIFDNSDYEKYKDSWNFKCSHWDDRAFSFDETSAKNTAFCNEKNGYSMQFSSSFGWGADVTAVYSEPVEINRKSILIIDYNCSSDGNGMTAEIISEPEFESQKISEFEKIPAFYAVSTSYISANFKLISDFENGNYYFRLKINTTNPVFTIRKILIISR